jgi:hypothetical protein
MLRKPIITVLHSLMALVVILPSCTLLDSEPTDEFYTDFSSGVPWRFHFNHDDPDCEVAVIADGVLHLRSAPQEGFGSGAQAWFTREIPRGSEIFFTVQFNDYFNEQHPAGHFNLLSRGPDNRIVFMAAADWFGYFATVNGEDPPELDGAEDLPGVVFETDRWYTFRFVLRDSALDVYIDGTMTHTVQYPSGLPEVGYFVFESHNEFRVKEFGVRF